MKRSRAAGLATLAVAAAGLAVGCLWVVWPLPPGLTAPPRTQGLRIEDRSGVLLRSTRAPDGGVREWLPLREIDPKLLQAFIALEDRRFFQHRGVDVQAVARALWQDIVARRIVSGASTITMQLARTLRPIPHTWGGKIAQALWALRLERHLTKQEILEQYLNRVPLGQGVSGVGGAAALYFGASAAELSWGQAAMLAGLAGAPSRDNPLVAPARARARRTLVLRRVALAGYAPRDALGRARIEPLLAGRDRAAFLAPHFTSRILQWAETAGDPLAGTWRTSLDLVLQQALEADVRHTVDALRDRGARQAAAVVLDNATGEILAWVGSPDFWSDSAGQVDMVVSPRQPGSALKPFLYALAFEHGYTAASILADISHTYQTPVGPYQPRNYDRQFHGPVRAREALASSYNVPAVELADRLGAGALLRVLHDAGFSSLREGADYYGLGLALGNGDVTLLDLANGYRALVNGGVWRPYRWQAVPAGPPGVATGASRRVVSAPAAALTLDILSDPIARIPGFGVETPFDFPFRAAVKTGTSHDFTDNWAVAATAGFTVAVWVGDFTGRAMRQVSGVSGAGPLLRRAVLATAARYDPGQLPDPSAVGAVRVRICRLSGLRAAPDCPGMDEWFVPGTEPERRCDWHRAGTVAWPAQYARWADAHGLAVAAAEPADPAAAADGGAEVIARAFHIISPLDGDRYQIPPGTDPRYATIGLRAAGAPAGDPVRWWIDGRRFARTRWPLRTGFHTIRASAGAYTDEVRIEVW